MNLFRRVTASLILLALCPVIAPAAVPSVRGDLRVMSFNIRYAEAPHDGINAWDQRRDLWARVVLARHPDIIGTQELLLSQAADIQQRLPGYAWFGQGRNGNALDQDDNEHMGVFYDTARLKLIAHGDFWYSETPEVPGSPNFDQPMPRMATWAQFEERGSGRRFYFFNTHFPHRPQAEPVRERCARMLLERIDKLPADVPVIVTGDFNSAPDAPDHALLTAQLKDAWEASPTRVGPDKSVHAFTGVPTKRIDWILERGLKVGQVEIADDHDGKVYPSDHFPVIADLRW